MRCLQAAEGRSLLPHCCPVVLRAAANGSTGPAHLAGMQLHGSGSGSASQPVSQGCWWGRHVPSRACASCSRCAACHVLWGMTSFASCDGSGVKQLLLVPGKRPAGVYSDRAPLLSGYSMQVARRATVQRPCCRYVVHFQQPALHCQAGWLHDGLRPHEPEPMRQVVMMALWQSGSGWSSTLPAPLTATAAAAAAAHPCARRSAMRRSRQVSSATKSASTIHAYAVRLPCARSAALRVVLKSSKGCRV